jgi:NitT/TauT family transport system substrate-binding protein
VLRQELTATPDVQYFVKALTKKISVALAGEQSWPETIATFRRQTLRIVPRTVDAPGGKALSRPRATTYKAPEWGAITNGIAVANTLKRRTQEMFRLSKTLLVRIVLLSCCVIPLAQHISHEALAQEKIRIGISFLSPSFLPTIVAEKKGFYAKYGLASEHVLISLSVAMSALGTGDLDYACSVAQGVAAAIKGIPLKLVMITQKNLVFALVVRPEVQRVTDLRGKTVGISYLGSTMHLVADTVFRQNGLVPGKDVNLFSAGDNQGRLAALEAGRIDASFGDPPFNIWADKRGYKVLAWAHDYVTLPQTSLLVTDKKIQQSRDQIKRVIKGTIEGLRFIQQRREESVDILAQWAKVDRETAKGMFESFFPAYSLDGTMTDEILRAALEDALRRAKIEKSIPINQIADRTILAEAQKELGIK